MYEYKDPERAQKWLDYTPPEMVAWLQYRDAQRHGEDHPDKVDAAARLLADEADRLTALMAEFGMEVLGYGSGVSFWDPKCARRPDPRMRDYNMRTLRAAEAKRANEWKMDGLGYISLSQREWSWLRPLLEELRDLRAREREREAQEKKEEGE